MFRTLSPRAALAAAVGVSLFFASGASAAVIVVNPGDPSWVSSGNSGGGSSQITAFAGIDGDGAVQLNGDRTRFGTTPNANFGALSNVSAFSYQWLVTSTDAGGVQSAQAPALRLNVFDPSTNRSIQFIYEDGEQSSPQFVNGAGSLNTTYAGDFFNGRVYTFTSGFGRGLYDGSGVLIAGSDSAQSFGSLISTLNSPNSIVFGLSLGAGSSVGSGFQGYGDNIHLAFNGGTDTTYNFAVSAAEPTPEPATMATFALMGGFAALGYRVRRKKSA